LQTARSFQRVSRLWSELAKELLYENIWVNNTEQWPLLSSALLQPEVAHLVRTVRLSPMRFDHNEFLLQHCGPHIKVLVQPEFPRFERLYASSLDDPLPPLLSLKRVYWIESTWSAQLLRAVLAAAPSLTHLTLTTSSSIGSGLNRAVSPVFPPLSCLQSLVLLPFSTFSVHTLLRDADLSRLTRLTIAPVHLGWQAFPVLPALRTLTLVNHPASMRTNVSFPALLTRCPRLEELRYSMHNHLIPPEEGQKASALACVALYQSSDVVPSLQQPLLDSGRPHATLLLGPAFGALEHVVLDGPGWEADGGIRMKWSEWAQLRARGCSVKVGIK
jgi:hypothetical protein